MKKILTLLTAVLLMTLAACGGSEPTEPTNPHTHKYTFEITREPTCAQEGIKTYTCTCGSRTTEKLDKLPHTWGDWATVTESTALENGQSKRSCSVCSDSETKKLPLKHSEECTVDNTLNNTNTAFESAAREYTQTGSPSTYDGNLAQFIFDGITAETLNVLSLKNFSASLTVVRQEGQQGQLLNGYFDGVSAYAVTEGAAAVKKTLKDGETAFGCQIKEIYIDDYVASEMHTYKTLEEVPEEALQKVVAGDATVTVFYNTPAKTSVWFTLQLGREGDARVFCLNAGFRF